MGKQSLMHYSLILEVMLFNQGWSFSNMFNSHCSKSEMCSMVTPSLARCAQQEQSREAFTVLWRADTDSVDRKALNVKVILSSLCTTEEKKPRFLGPDSTLGSLGGQRSYMRQTLPRGLPPSKLFKTLDSFPFNLFYKSSKVSVGTGEFFTLPRTLWDGKLSARGQPI